MDRLRDIEIRPAAVIAVALAAGFLVWFFAIRNDDGGSDGGSGTRAVSADELADAAADLDTPLYWVGERGDTTLELRQQPNGNVFLRYLPAGAEVGDPAQDYLTIGTYPFADAHAALEVVARRKGASSHQTPDGALVVTSAKTPTSVYLAYPDEDVQIEVYDPDPEVALELATSGRVQPVD